VITPRERADRYLNRVVQLAGGREPRIHAIPDTRREAHLPPVVAFAFADTPEPGLITGFTFGLSQARHPDWRLGRPELAITVESNDVGWPIAIGLMAERLRGECPFSYGNTINIGEPITDETRMTAFVVFGPAFPVENDAGRIDVGDDLPIFLTGCYPIHHSEMDFITRRGLEAFWNLEWDPMDVRRGPVIFD
jgi:suppressor of fused protein SUFU